MFSLILRMSAEEVGEPTGQEICDQDLYYLQIMIFMGSASLGPLKISVQRKLPSSLHKEIKVRQGDVLYQKDETNVSRLGWK